MLGTIEEPEFRVGRVHLKAGILVPLITGAIRLIGLTLRIRMTDHAGYFSGDHGGRYIFVFWHNRMFVMPILYARFYFRRKTGNATAANVLTSFSGEGTLLSKIVARFGMGAVRGSSSRRGAVALLELSGKIEDGYDVIVTPDGPRGPRYQLGPGVIFLAEKTGAPIMPIEIQYSRSIRLGTWDRFEIPLPFSRVDVTLHPRHHIGSLESEEAFEAERQSLETVMRGASC
jgi:lysophospholipid acyltransferase (LPLAT)-like uncharacterized protein